MGKLDGKVAIVTGGCRGIGLAVVERLCREGAFVYALDYVVPDGDISTDESIKDQIATIQTDVTSSESIQSAFDKVISEKDRVDILVNNAGITRDTLILRMKEEDWDAVIDTNLKGAFLCCKLIARKMMGQRSGRIINIGSIVGLGGNAGQVNYSSSKSGLVGLTKSLAKEFGSRNILVNLIAPGYVITPMTEKLTDEQKEAYTNIIPLKRGAKPEDIANAVHFFSSDDSSYITGQVLNVCGGLTM